MPQEVVSSPSEEKGRQRWGHHVVKCNRQDSWKGWRIGPCGILRTFLRLREWMTGQNGRERLSWGPRSRDVLGKIGEKGEQFMKVQAAQGDQGSTRRSVQAGSWEPRGRACPWGGLRLILTLASREKMHTWAYNKVGQGAKMLHEERLQLGRVRKGWTTPLNPELLWVGLGTERAEPSSAMWPWASLVSSLVSISPCGKCRGTSAQHRQCGVE